MEKLPVCTIEACIQVICVLKCRKKKLTYFLIMEISGAMIGFPRHMALLKMSGKICSSRKDP